jgi:xylan 1,4-beta-xylosidase
MRQTDEEAPIQRCGHGKPVQTQNGDWYMVYLCGRKLNGEYSILGRETALDPITWTMDGWPVVNNLKGPSVLQKKPVTVLCQSDTHQPTRENAGTGQTERESGATDVMRKGWGDKLSLEWMTPRPPSESAIQIENGILSLKGSRYPLSEVAARNILLRRQEHFRFYAETTLPVSTAQSMREQQEAGLICYYDENTWVALCMVRENSSLYIMIKEHIGDKDSTYGKEELPKWFESITLSVETDGLNRRFTYFVRNTGQEFGQEECSRKEVAALENVYYLCDEGLKKGKRFTGAMIGVYAYAGEEEWKAQFSDFSYRPGT